MPNATAAPPMSATSTVRQTSTTRIDAAPAPEGCAAPANPNSTPPIRPANPAPSVPAAPSSNHRLAGAGGIDAGPPGVGERSRTAGGTVTGAETTSSDAGVSTSATNRYPCFGTVSMKRGCVALSPSARRSERMHCVSASSVTGIPCHTSAMNRSFDTSRPASPTSSNSASKYRALTSTGASPASSRRSRASTTKFPKR